MGGLSFYEDTEGNKYVVGADTVPKKLGSGGIPILLGQAYILSGQTVPIFTASEDIENVYIIAPDNNYITTFYDNGVPVPSEQIMGAGIGALWKLNNTVLKDHVISGYWYAGGTWWFTAFKIL